MIYLRLEQIGGNPDTIQLNRKTIATLSLWAIQFEISHKPQWFDKRPHFAQHHSLELWGQIQTVNSTSGAIYLDALLGCININHNWMLGGPEQVARVPSLRLLHMLSGVDPISPAVKGTSWHHARIVQHHTNFEGLLCYHTINVIHILSVGKQEGHSVGWVVYKPCPQEHTLFMNTLVQVAYLAKQYQGKVPRWILRFVLRSLSSDPPPPASVAVNCLLVIAIDLDCDLSGAGDISLSNRYVHT